MTTKAVTAKIETKMEIKIGETAGKIWKLLQDRGRISIAQLPKLLEERDVVVYQGLGWLARESKIAYVNEGSRTFVELKS